MLSITNDQGFHLFSVGTNKQDNIGNIYDRFCFQWKKWTKETFPYYKNGKVAITITNEDEIIINYVRNGKSEFIISAKKWTFPLTIKFFLNEYDKFYTKGDNDMFQIVNNDLPLISAYAVNTAVFTQRVSIITSTWLVMTGNIFPFYKGGKVAIEIDRKGHITINYFQKNSSLFKFESNCELEDAIKKFLEYYYQQIESREYHS